MWNTSAFEMIATSYDDDKYILGCAYFGLMAIGTVFTYLYTT